MKSVDNNIDAQKYSEHQTKGCSSVSKHLCQKKTVLIEATNMILEISQKVANSVAVKVVKLQLQLFFNHLTILKD